MANKKNPPTSDSSVAPAAPSSNVPDTAAAIPVIYSTFVAQQQISGPLPSPEVLRQYEATSPGAAERLIRLAEQEAEHRRKMESEIIAIQGRDQHSYRQSEFWGQFFGFSMGSIAILGAVFAAVHGAQIAASFIGTTGVGGLVSAFILGRTYFLKQKKQEFEQEMQVIASKSDRAKSRQ